MNLDELMKYLRANHISDDASVIFIIKDEKFIEDRFMELWEFVSIYLSEDEQRTFINLFEEFLDHAALARAYRRTKGFPS
jgi:hypothetical protein